MSLLAQYSWKQWLQKHFRQGLQGISAQHCRGLVGLQTDNTVLPSAVGLCPLSAQWWPEREHKRSLAERDPLTSLGNLLWVLWTKVKHFIFWGLGAGRSLPPGALNRTTALCWSASSPLSSLFSPPQTQSWKRSREIHCRYLYWCVSFSPSFLKYHTVPFLRVESRVRELQFHALRPE